MLRFLIVYLIVVISVLVKGAGFGPGLWFENDYSNQHGKRHYFVYVPKNLSQKPAVMLMLHGCAQQAADFAKASGMNEIAENGGFIAVYPEQTYLENKSKCWNWFIPENEKKDSAELGQLAELTNSIVKKYSADENKVYVAGISAGAAMAANLIACYSDVFSGAGIHSGLEYMAGSDETTARQSMNYGSSHDLKQVADQAVKCAGKKTQPVVLTVIHGNADTLVVPKNANRVVELYTYINDLLDDGILNGSQSLNVIKSEKGFKDYNFLVESYGNQQKILIKKVSVDSLGHAWSGAHGFGAFVDTKGPDASQMIWQFLSENSLPRN